MPSKPSSDAPKCVTRLNFLSHDRGGQGLRHDLNRIEFAHYLVGEGKGPDGVLPTMFTADELEPPRAFRDAWLMRDKTLDAEQVGFDGKKWPLMQAWCVELMKRRLEGEPRHYRLMVSPEQEVGQVVDLQQFALKLVDRMEHDLGRKLQWVGSAHHNTARPHIHVCVRGVDCADEPVFFPGQYWKKGIRWRGSQVLADLMAENKGLKRAG